MREVVTYVADDGTVFDNDVDCRKYEENILMTKLDIEFFDKSFSKLDIKEYDTETFLSLAHYVKFSNEEAKENYDTLLSDYGFSTDGLWDDTKALTFYYDNRSDCWKSLCDKINEMKNFIIRCENCGLI